MQVIIQIHIWHLNQVLQIMTGAMLDRWEAIMPLYRVLKECNIFNIQVIYIILLVSHNAYKCVCHWISDTAGLDIRDSDDVSDIGVSSWYLHSSHDFQLEYSSGD